MSHNTKIDVKFTDLKALQLAVEELGYEFSTTKPARAWGNKAIPDSIASIRTGDVITGMSFNFDIAVVPNKDGGYDFIADRWQGQLEKHVGKDFAKIKQLYAVHQATMLAKKKGYVVKRKLQEDGRIKLTIGGIK